MKCSLCFLLVFSVISVFANDASVESIEDGRGEKAGEDPTTKEDSSMSPGNVTETDMTDSEVLQSAMCLLGQVNNQQHFQHHPDCIYAQQAPQPQPLIQRVSCLLSSLSSLLALCAPPEYPVGPDSCESGEVGNPAFDHFENEEFDKTLDDIATVIAQRIKEESEKDAEQSCSEEVATPPESEDLAVSKLEVTEEPEIATQPSTTAKPETETESMEKTEITVAPPKPPKSSSKKRPKNPENSAPKSAKNLEPKTLDSEEKSKGLEDVKDMNLLEVLTGSASR